MIIAIPTENGRLASHFGKVGEFTFVTIKDGKIEGKESATPPPHERGILPKWLNSKNTDLVIAGGMGRRARSLFEQYGIKVISSVQPKAIEELVDDYLKESLVKGEDPCDH